MSFDLGRIREEAAAAPLASPYPPELSIAVVNDTFRLARLGPPDGRRWKGLLVAAKHTPIVEQLGMLAHLLTVTSLRDETVKALGADIDLKKALEGFFASVAPLTAEMIRANAFRQEEFLRKWIATVGGRVAGEGEEQSRKRLEQLDYRKTLAEYDRAEKARHDEAARRAKMLKEAADREAAARGWRE